MTVYVPTLEREQLVQLADDVRQLTQPWEYGVLRSRQWWDRNRHRKNETWTSWEPRAPLLDLLAAAVQREHAPRPREERRTVPGPSLPVNDDAIARQQDIRGGVAQWCARLDCWPTSTLDPEAWLRLALRALVGAAAGLDRQQGERLVHDVRRWWTWAARQAGYSPDELLDQRGSR